MQVAIAHMRPGMIFRDHDNRAAVLISISVIRDIAVLYYSAEGRNRRTIEISDHVIEVQPCP